MKDKLNVGFVGLGGRGQWMLKTLLSTMKDVEVIGVCDTYEDRALKGAKIVEKRRKYSPIVTQDYNDLIKNDRIDTIFIASAWESHVEIALKAMEAGKSTAMEVGGAYTLQECWDLVDCYERTKTPVMLLENCCYGEYELMALNMVRRGVFGEIVHCSGGYHHDIRNEITFGNVNRHYRLNNYIERNCENYPTHEIGPIAKALDINNGNRFVSLISVGSKSEGLKDYVVRYKPDDKLINTEFKQSDIVTTSIKCSNGETVVITLDTSLPRTYSRGFTVRGTRGYYAEETNAVVIDKRRPYTSASTLGARNSAKKYRRRYRHDVWKNAPLAVKKYGHGGMDYFVMRAMVDAFKNGTPAPIDVYDTALWMSITPLSEISIKEERFVEIPDFTRGRYMNRIEKAVGIYNLDK